MSDIGRYRPDTARWVIDQIKLMKSRQFYSPAELLAALGAPANQNAIHVQNTELSAAPAYACMQVKGIRNPDSGSVDRTYLQVEQPSDQYGRDGWYVFNGPEKIPVDGYGVAYAGPHAKVLGFSGSFGDRCLPLTGTWYVTKDPTGWMHFGGSDDVSEDVIRVLCSPIMSTTAIFEPPGGGIPALSASTMGKATCDLKQISVDGSGNASTAAATDENSSQITHTVHNMATTAVAGSADIQAVLIGGVWIANWEQC